MPRPYGKDSIVAREELYQEDFEEDLIIRPLAWDEVLKKALQCRIVAVQAPPGSGKSTLAAWVDWKLSQETHVEYLAGRNFQNLGDSAIVDALNASPDATVVLLDDAHLVQRHLHYLMRSAVPPNIRFLFLSRPGGFAGIPAISEPIIDLSLTASAIARAMARRYTASPAEAESLLSETKSDLVFTKWLLGAMQQDPSQRNLTLHKAAAAKLKEFWDADKELLRLMLVLCVYRWLELQCSVDSLNDEYGFTSEPIEKLTTGLREGGFDSGTKSLFLDRHPKLAALFQREANGFQHYTVDVLRPTCAAFRVNHSGLEDRPFGQIVLGLAVSSRCLRASDVVDRLLFSKLHSDCAEFARTAAQIEIKMNPILNCLDPSAVERRLTISFAAYDAMRRETNEEQAWGQLTALRAQLGIAVNPTTDFERKGYLLYQVGYHYYLTNQLDKAVRQFEEAAEADDLWARRTNSQVHFGKAAMSRIMAVRARADVLMGVSDCAADLTLDFDEVDALARRLDCERIRLGQLIIGAQGIDWSWLQRWHLNALLHLAELYGCLGNESSVESLLTEAIAKASIIDLAKSTDQFAKRARATLAFYQGRFETVVDLLKDIEAAKDKAGEGIGRLAQLLAMSYRKLGNTGECEHWCQWLTEECPVDKANGPTAAWAKAVLKSMNH